MAQAEFPDGRKERLSIVAGEADTLEEALKRQQEALERAMSFARDALARGAETVTVFREPHSFSGPGHRCAVCGGIATDEIHSTASPEARG